MSARYVHKQVDRAIEDVGHDGPGYGEVYVIANPGEGVADVHRERSSCPTCPVMPKVKRNYDALELKFDRRFADNWMFNASYTLSRLYGNYPGLASSDEIARVAPNVTRLFDSLVMAYDENGAAPCTGRLNTDRPHQFKLSRRLPVAHQDRDRRRLARGERHPDLPHGQHGELHAGLLQGTAERWADALAHASSTCNVVQDIPLARGVRGQTRRQRPQPVRPEGGDRRVPQREPRRTLPIPMETFFAGFDAEARMTARNILRDPRLLQANAWQPAREVRLNFKLTF